MAIDGGGAKCQANPARPSRSATEYSPLRISRSTSVCRGWWAQRRRGEPARVAPPPPKPRRFYGTVELTNPMRLGSDAGKIAEEVIAHLAALPGARVKVTLEIEATLPEGVPDHVVQVVKQNGRTLKFSSQGFEVE